MLVLESRQELSDFSPNSQDFSRIVGVKSTFS